jgi:5-methylcytosine-specific restriction endonuclease McrA
VNPRPKEKEYHKYLKSADWKSNRLDVLKRDSFSCRRCGENGRPGNELDVHHLTYERIYHEELRDLITLCRGCHGEVHYTGEVIECSELDDSDLPF